ncbi:MAG: efflux RND transporter permease subunit [Hydrogenophaga sp.]|jgi:HAE1 family hydrophobic/amphiphilic exporter-1|uniref:efflux RND transporter permease subunit n=1 Tax=Hydrogenophaga sp. TaxID=1904254 RepID=UPI001D9BFE6C|nr:efflux RND transporter permease subunit [Hydrogenophaga sp.]MBW0171809.1 efflux RND transporter permease subunit [Hydrogenophaga sp.]MBW0182659.1 efflux RND transporter permease subunit [Hydrogenophaga sp.]
MAYFFIHRPVFAWVLSIVVMLAGAMSIFTLPLEQYPDIAPPRVSINTTYTGASAETVADSVTQVIEQQLKGIDNVLYMSSTSDSAGRSRTQLTFAPGTNIDVAQVQVQNKLQTALNRLPEAVKSRGVFVNKGGQDNLMTYVFTSPDPTVTQVAIGDYITSNVVDVISRIDGVGDVTVFGTSYAMRIWMDPGKLEQFALMPSDLISALNSQNAQVSAGQLGALPAVKDQMLNATITARTKLKTVEEFEAIVLKAAADGSLVTMGDVARVELDADNLTVKSRLNNRPGAGLGVVLADGANAMAVANAVNAKMAELAPFFPDGITGVISSDTTPYVRASIKEVAITLVEAMLLVVIVMYVFLQNLRATLIPAIAVPVVLLGTFGVLSALGYSINMLTMFAMVLAIGLLVDDAIVVVENVERVMHQEGLPAKEATIKSMAEITPALVGIGLTLSAVFIPMAFFSGSVGVIYRQFSVAIVSAMAFSVLVALTLTPALCATLLKPTNHLHGEPRKGLLGWFDRFFQGFNKGFDRNATRYQGVVGQLLVRSKRVMLVFALLIGGVVLLFQKLPTSFLPVEDQGFITASVTLPAGSSDAQLEVVLQDITRYFTAQPDVLRVNSLAGNSGNQSAGTIFVRLKPWDDRPNAEQSAEFIARKATRDLSRIRAARIFVSLPPAVRGLGSDAGVNFMLKDINGLGNDALRAAKDRVIQLASERPELANMRTTDFDVTSELKVVIDDRKAAALGVSTNDINNVLSSAVGGAYVNDFVHNGRVKRVYVQGDAPYRMLPQDIGQWTVRNRNGEMVPLAAFTSTTWTSSAPQLLRYNGSPAMEMVASTGAGVSSGDAMRAVEAIMAQMPVGIGYEWTGASLQERQSGAQAPLLYAISILFVFLCLAALYESWSVPFSVILAVPLGVVGALLATYLRGMSNDVYFQVGLLTTVGLASKNAILIVEFAVQLMEQGKSVFDATLEAVRRRLRPILMTSLAFGFGVLPLALGTGPGAASRQAIGTAVLGGTVLSTLLGLFFVPVFFLLVRSWVQRRQNKKTPPAPVAPLSPQGDA